jgi:hypothetical protein
MSNDKKDNHDNPDVNESNSRTHAQKSGGHMGAGRSGTEDLGSEKPTSGEDKGSNQPGHRNEKKS